MKKDDNQSDTDELLKNEELEPTIQQPNKRKKKYLGRINYKVSIHRSIHEINKIFIQDYYLTTSLFLYYYHHPLLKQCIYYGF